MTTVEASRTKFGTMLTMVGRRKARCKDCDYWDIRNGSRCHYHLPKDMQGEKWWYDKACRNCGLHFIPANKYAGGRNDGWFEVASESSEPWAACQKCSTYNSRGPTENNITMTPAVIAI